MFPFNEDKLIKRINNLFANMDAAFRDVERDFGKRGILPTVTIPGILNAFTETHEQEETEESITFYKNGKVHREDGPAVVYKPLKGMDGEFTRDPEYWLDGKQVTKEAVEALTAKKEEEKVYSVYINDVEYKVKGKKKLEELKQLLK